MTENLRLLPFLEDYKALCLKHNLTFEPISCITPHVKPAILVLDISPAPETLFQAKSIWINKGIGYIEDMDTLDLTEQELEALESYHE